jgi:hypothetical protein
LALEAREVRLLRLTQLLATRELRAALHPLGHMYLLMAAAVEMAAALQLILAAAAAALVERGLQVQAQNVVDFPQVIILVALLKQITQAEAARV